MVFQARDVIVRSNYAAYPFPGGLFDQPKDLMDDIFLELDIEAYQEAVERENAAGNDSEDDG